MIRLNLPAKHGDPVHILCLGAHSDDIEIGCGGTVLQLAEQYPGCVFHWVVFSATGVRKAEADSASRLFVAPDNLKIPFIKNFEDGFMPFVGGEVKRVFEELKRSISPDLVFTHYRKDAHQDHRLLAELTWSTFRDHLILEYEIPKYDGDMGQPNVFVPLGSELYETKVRYVMETFQSQRSKRWFQPETFLSLMRLRGMECNAPSGYAEAFYCHKVSL
ncbi:MAG: PIG-L family deacetylase [Candidatus Acidiferrum sp.]